MEQVFGGLNPDPPAPPEPTDAEPGTVRKIDVMRDRDTGGYQLRHPQDPNKFDDFEDETPLYIPEIKEDE